MFSLDDVRFHARKLVHLRSTGYTHLTADFFFGKFPHVGVRSRHARRNNGRRSSGHDRETGERSVANHSWLAVSTKSLSNLRTTFRNFSASNRKFLARRMPTRIRFVLRKNYLGTILARAILAEQSSPDRESRQIFKRTRDS